MEALFFITKPSFFSSFKPYNSFLISFNTPFLISVLSLVPIVVLMFLSFCVHRLIGPGLFMNLARVIPSLILSMCFLIMLDNFTYTLFKFGVTSTEGPWRYVYGLLWLTGFFLIYGCFLKSDLNGFLKDHSNNIIRLVAALFIISIICVLYRCISFDNFPTNKVIFSDLKYTRQPNILLLGGDGIEANHMSIYGYRRDTTPFIRSFMKGGLIIENCFVNSGMTGASITSMLTGRLPTQTKLIYPPDILTGEDSYRHLPGILRKYGYRSMQISMRHQADAYDSNFRDSFDSVNFRSIKKSGGHLLLKSLRPRFDLEVYFFDQIFDRVYQRLLHILGIRKMTDLHEIAVKEKRELFSDVERRLPEIFRFIVENNTPFFIHAHLMGTHGPWYNTEQRVFSAGQEQSQRRMIDFYEDAILDFDNRFKQIIDRLEEAGKLQNTLIIIYSDHGIKHDTDVRIPLLFLFPHGEFSGKVSTNAQLIDVSPTILDYLGIDIPSWMKGESLISSKIDPLRPIISIRALLRQKRIPWDSKERRSPKFYGIHSIHLTVCHRSYGLYLKSGKMQMRDIRGHTARCFEDTLPTPEKAKLLILNHLYENGYAVTEL